MSRFKRHISLFLLILFTSFVFAAPATAALAWNHISDADEDKITWIKQCDSFSSADHKINSVEKNTNHIFNLIQNNNTSDAPEEDQVILINCNNNLFLTTSNISADNLKAEGILKSIFLLNSSQLILDNIGDPPRIIS